MEKFKKQKILDSFCGKKESDDYSDWLLAKYIQKNKKNHILFSKFGRENNFKTESLQLHFVKTTYKRNINFKSLDGVLAQNNPIAFKYFFSRNQIDIYGLLHDRYLSWKNYFQDFWRGSVNGISPIKMWNMSIVGALIFGMFLMTFIYRYLGQGVGAVSVQNNAENSIQTETANNSVGKVLGESDENPWDKSGNIKMEDYVSQIMANYQKDSENEQKLNNEIKKIVRGYPIEKMVPFIAKQDRAIAAFLVAIAKKESDWGKHAPVLNGEDCYNYWGYRGKRARMGTGGHTCFNSPEDAVKTVSKRLKFLVSNEKVNTPGKMVIVWKCGYDCSWDNPASVRKWVSDVDYYFKKFDKFNK